MVVSDSTAVVMTAPQPYLTQTDGIKSEARTGDCCFAPFLSMTWPSVVWSPNSG